MEATLELGAGERAQQAAQQVAGIFAPSTVQSMAQLKQAAAGAREYLLEPTPAHLASARAALTALAPTPRRRFSVWNAAGQHLFDLPERPPGRGADDRGVAAPATQPAPGISAIQAEGDLPFADATVTVMSADGQGAALGAISARTALSLSPPDLLARLIGGDARILFGNREGEIWTDLGHTVPGPPVKRSTTAVQRYAARDGGERVGAIHALSGTPWVVWVELPRAAVVAGARDFLWQMTVVVFLVAVGALLLMRRLVLGVTTPLAAMTTAAEAMVAGDYSRRVAADRSDEIGRLGRAFNAMSDDIARELGERKRAHDLLQEREAQLHLYATDSPVAVAMFDRELRFLVASRRWVEDYRLGDQVLVGRTLYDVFPQMPPHWREVHRRCLAGAEEKRDDDSFTRADGTVAWLRSEARPWHQAGGGIGGLIIFTEDITARKAAEAAVRGSEGRYRALFDYAPDGILIADPQSRYIDANRSMCEMLGHTRVQLVGLQASDIVVPGEVAHIGPALAVIATRADYRRQWQFRRRDGSVFEADVIATTMPDGNLLAMIRDVTERNRAVAAVSAAEERMRFALESADVGIWEMDFPTGAVRWSPILEAHYGLPTGTFEGTGAAFTNRVHVDDRDAVRATVANAMTTGADFSLQHRIVRPDGTVRWSNGVGRFHLDAEGRPDRGVGISLDVTERHLLEDQFQQAQKMEAVNNLLTAILGYCELVLDDLTADNPIRHEVAEIHKAGARAADLTKQLLAFSRKQIIEPTLLDVNAVVTGLHSMLGRLIGDDVVIVVTLSELPALVVADRGQVEQVIVNLAVNARDAMATGGRLTIETAAVDLDEDYAALHLGVTPGAYVAIIVTDTGVGMSADVQGHLFEPFFTTKEPGKGTGLGLATVHGVVSRGGGSVGVHSEVGKGSSFKVYLPRAHGTVLPVLAPHAASAVPHSGGLTVLVVDDAESLRELLQRTLQRQGYRVLLAGDAAEARRQFDAHAAIDVLLTDVVMPGASGPELTADLLGRRADLKVIYMSGYTQDAIVHHGVLTPGTAFLHKPFTAKALGDKIRDVLGR